MENKIFCLICLLLFNIFFISHAFSDPILRIEVGQHTAMINRMAVNSAETLMATAADDKTVRIWNLPEGTLYTTLRVPIDEHVKGALYAVAISPDGKTLITSGETIDENQKFSLYVFDIEKRVLKARIPNLPAAIYHLAYSKDGKYFAAAYAAGYGVQAWDSQSGKSVLSDKNYNERSTWLEFNNSGQLATASHDGAIRLYDNQFTLIKKAAPNPQGKPNSVAFSANGQLLAIGYANLMQVDITDLNLNKLTTLTIDNLLGNNAAIVKWQKNSNTELLVSGDMRTNNGNFIIRHWQGIDSTNKHFKDTEVSKNIVTDILPLAIDEQNKIDTLFASADPAWGALKNDQIAYLNQANLWDARLVELPEKTFFISKDGLTVAYSQSGDANDVALFDVNRMILEPQGSNAGSMPALLPAIKDSNLIKISNWRRNIPTFNGKTLEFDKFEESLALAITPNADYVLIGTNYNLRWYDKSGKQIRKTSVPASVYGVNISADGKLAIAAIGDGTLRWYSLVPGEELNELVTLFPYDKGKDWIIWTKEGFFGSSDGGGYRLAGYHLNKGENKRPEWIEFSQIFQSYYAPELILPKLLRQETKILERLKNHENIQDRFDKNAVPIIELVEYCVKTGTEQSPLLLQTTVQSHQTENKELQYLDKFKLVINKFHYWLLAKFKNQNSEKNIDQSQQTASNDTKTQPICYAINGQGETRGFKRKDKVQSTIYRNQLDKNTETIELKYIVKPREGGLGDIDIYVNGQIQTSQKQNIAKSIKNENQDLNFVQDVNLKEGENEISIHAYDKSGGATGVSNSLALINPNPSFTASSSTTRDQSRLILVAIGIDRYPPPNQLKYAVKDSSDFIKTVISRKSPAYTTTLPFEIFDEKATLKNIEATFDNIQSIISENDTVLVYLSGHGLKNEKDFYFIPYDVNDDNLEETALSQRVLKKNIAKLSKTNKVFIFIDSCHSGAVNLNIIQEEITSFDKIKHQLGDNIFVLAAAGENQEAQDQFIFANNQKAENGLFAYAVLEGLNGKARRMDDNIVDSFNLGGYVQRKIDAITKNQTLYKQKARFQLLESGDALNFDITHYE